MRMEVGVDTTGSGFSGGRGTSDAGPAANCNGEGIAKRPADDVLSMSMAQSIF